MTDKEKAHKSCYEQIIKKDGKKLILLDELKEAYLNGLEAGRKLGKEEQWEATEKAQKKTSARIRELEKENAELKEYVSRAGYRIAELKHEVDELKEKISELESIIESLQSCTNCEHFDGTNYCKSTRCVIHQFDGYCSGPGSVQEMERHKRTQAYHRRSRTVAVKKLGQRP